MAKQIFEKKKVVNLVGVLEKNDDGEYVVVVEDKDSFTQYDLSEVLDEILGSIIFLKSEENL